MSSHESYDVLQVLYIPQHEDDQPNKHFALKKRTLDEVIKTEVNDRVYAWRTYKKDVEHGILLASEHASGHSAWTFTSGVLVSFECLIAQKKISTATAQRKRAQGYCKVLLVKNDLFAYVTDADVIGPNVKIEA